MNSNLNKTNRIRGKEKRKVERLKIKIVNTKNIPIIVLVNKMSD